MMLNGQRIVKYRTMETMRVFINKKNLAAVKAESAIKSLYMHSQTTGDPVHAI